MSRRPLPGRRPRVYATVGWDPPLQTFFAMVFEEPPADSDADEREILWRGFGAAFNDVLTADEAIDLVRPHVDGIPDGLADALRMDRAANR